jgi:hypothetical protein
MWHQQKQLPVAHRQVLDDLRQAVRGSTDTTPEMTTLW